VKPTPLKRKLPWIEKKQKSVGSAFGYKKWHAWKHKFRTFLIIIYESNPWRKLRDFLTIKSPELQPEVI
jgi:hypothetical protein